MVDQDNEEALPRSVKRMRHILRALRINQWAKNLLLFVPLATAHEIANIELLFDVCTAFLCFGLFASAGYVCNDLLDLEADRLHPTKAQRPFASGELSPVAGVLLIAGMVVAGLVPAVALLSRAFTLMLIGYLVLSVCYSLYLKKLLLIDVIVLAGLYTYRVIAGGVVTEVAVTTWLLAFSMFIFLSLAFAKRYNELMLLRSCDSSSAAGRAYRVDETDLLLNVGPTTGCISVLVLALYISESPDVSRLYGSVALLWLLCPILLYWILRVWFLARRGELPGDPITFALTDRVSLVVGVLVIVLLFVAARWPVFASLEA